VKSIATRGAPLLEQAVLADFIAQGHFGRHLRRMRAVYAERLAVLLGCAERRLGGLLEFSPIEAGLQTTAWLCGAVDGAAAAAAAERRDVEVTPLSRRFPPGRTGRAGLVLGFAAVGADEIRRGVDDLAAALEECQPGHRPSGRQA
jgi:GntR family transcriptional regulator/MocR family aminotransferase